MTKIEALKELLEINLNILNKYTHLKNLRINFKDDEFTVFDKNNFIIFKDKLSNHDFTFDSQERFILNVAEKVTSVVMNLENLKQEDEWSLTGYIDTNNEKNYAHILGNSKEIDAHDSILINIEELFSNKNESIRKIYNKFKNTSLKKIIKEIKNNLDEDKFNVILYSNEQLCYFEIYIDVKMYEDSISIRFIFDLKEYENSWNPEILEIDNIEDKADYCDAKLFYSPTSYEEFVKAEKIIEKIVEKHLKEFTKKINKIATSS